MNIDKAVNVNFNARVTGKEGKYLMVETIAIDRKGNEYGTEHVMELGKGMKASKGDYVHVEGTVSMNEDGVNLITASKCSLWPDEPADLRMNAWVVGEAASNFIEPKSIDEVGGDRKPFGVASIKLGNRFQRGIVFNQLIPTFRKNLKAGAIFKMAGRLQYRKYIANDQTEKTVMEIVCDNNYTEILKASTKKNPFAFSEEDVMAGFKKAEA